MSFRFKRASGRIGRTTRVDTRHETQRAELQNHTLYQDFRSIAARVMCDMFNLTVDNCDKITQEAIDYRENLIDAMIGAVILHNEKKK